MKTASILRALALLLICLLPALPVRAADALRSAYRSGVSTTLSASVGAFNSVLGHAANGYGQVRLTDKGFFLATPGSSRAPRMWWAFEAREYHGDTKGRKFDMLLGFEKPLGVRTRLGFATGYGVADLDTGREIRSRTLSFAPYLQTKLNDNLGFKAWAALARPDYRLGSTPRAAWRTAAGLDASGAYKLRTLDLSGTAGLSMSRQASSGVGDVSGWQVGKLTATLRTRATLRLERNFRPYFELGYSYGAWVDAGSSGDYETPSLKTGLSWTHKKRSFTLNLNGTQVFDPVQPLVLSTNYSIRF
ncbi:autotransporter outer membrane beta-barrel domain-containing protein [Salipiger sp. PrR002]|uniref:autotransporter outer membrane beta-barrel domain-containing protein n=1 Tax=Salipiger sp. PrR002 TaxID=2706489 RepID=UPI0013BCA47E|nr:autotransporter outer membrane beta-barrel domain-containing protein [Salipiger sp. PrR002]NDV98527.1 autotransporter outer membrane beta-barrel domain-containing protein [Salipiger sp. PrR002]NDW57362.1 autotransporter outer membrane beta-barrel domain-containing protein [Salipiger sp. PrR004]